MELPFKGLHYLQVYNDPRNHSHVCLGQQFVQGYEHYYLAVELSFQSTDYSQEREDPAQKFQILQNGVLVLVPHSAAGHGNATFEKVVDKRNASSM
jgi:hypothetical protein